MANSWRHLVRTICKEEAMYLERKERHAIELRERKKMNLMAAMAKSRDRKSRKAREDFRRSAFCGTILAPGQQDPKRNN